MVSSTRHLSGPSGGDPWPITRAFQVGSLTDYHKA